MRKYSLGIDIGTTSTKAVIFSDNGKKIHQVSIKYPLLSSESKVAEQDPDEILRAAKKTVKNVIKSSNILT